MSASPSTAAVDVSGPWFEELEPGTMLRGAPALTLTEGLAALHQSILGDRLRLPLDAELARRVTGSDRGIAHPALVWDVAIGQSTLVTQRVVANLFYRGLVLRRLPAIGDTLATTTEVVALRQNQTRAGRDATGMAVLRIRTVDQAGRDVLDFWRCAMLPLRDPAGETGRDDDFAALPAALDEQTLRAAVAGWRLDAFRAGVPGSHADAHPAPGAAWRIASGDVVSSAPELARLTLNLAAVHHDREAGGRGRRLVYGGHTIGLAAAQATRALPDLVTIAGWHGCDHLAPVYEGDTLRSTLALERVERMPEGGALAHLRSQVHAVRADGGPDEDVLDWRFVAVLA